MGTDLQRTTVPPEIHAAWAARHGIAAADRLAGAENLADALRDATIPPNTTDTYAKGWSVWERFCTTQNFPLTEGSRGALVAFVAWALDRGRQTPGPGGTLGYAPSSVQSHLTATVVELRRRGHPVSKDAHSEARATIKRLATQLAKQGERRGRGQAPAADLDNLHRIAESCDTTPTGRRDLALVLTGFHFASRASEVAGLLLADIAVHARGMKVAVVSGKTERSIRTVKIPYNNDEPAICAVRAWQAWTEVYGTSDLKRPAFPRIDRWENIGGPMAPDSVTAAVARIAQRSGVPLRWTGHSLRSGLATESRRNGKDALVIAEQGGWAKNSKAMMGYMRRADEWDDNAAAGLRRVQN
ncbi:tyrosine-type recombinase/integrase [Streptomyces tendae]|uniref:tyrosine-type recombinase/integrase n=1 Tax=Streptomyces tendae TaxID=1932 RepID=UPI003815600D